MRFLEAELPWARAAFTTRVGGVSEGDFASLNLGLLTGDEFESVRENRRRAAGAVEVEPDRVLIGYQVHGTEIEMRDRPPDPNPYSRPASTPAQMDGQATSTADLAPLVFVADCLPVALAGPEGVAMIHCGWRGLAGGIVAAGAEAVGASAAAVGPGIGRCCYEVGSEVLAEFEPLGDDVADGRMLDLELIAKRLLAKAGVEQIEAAGLCTSCNPDLFFSHRRDQGHTGRQGGFVRRWLD
jgi:polyphenol oxidase